MYPALLLTSLALVGAPGDQSAKIPASVELDVPYADGGDQQKLDLYLPENKKNFTTIVFTFGGGWHRGGRKSVALVGKKWQSLGYACVLPSHRLSPEAKFPVPARDLAAAFAWVKKNIGSRGGDPKRVVLMGHSSGAHLSLLIATNATFLAAHSLSPADVHGLVGLSTPVDLEPHEDKHGFGDALMAGKGADAFSRSAAVLKAASPIQYLSRNLPPTLLVVGENDFPMLEQDARTFAAKARKSGRDVAVYVGKDRDHMGVVRALIEDRNPILERVSEFLKGLDDKAP
jgi:acetyl esterase/lipase